MPKLVPLGKTGPNAVLVEELELLLDQARRGDVQAVAYAAVRRDHARTWCLRGKAGYNNDLGASVLVLIHATGHWLSDVPEAAGLD